ncbi:MAG TPA: PDZ domain-containing protein [Candidatus Omnitrophica bacterium]|nr:PDZ domain-containing protein [Candidatus Omnitrophota bacterium]
MKIIILFFFYLIASGCVTTGPPVYKPEIYRARQELRAKALKYRLQKEQIVSEVGYRLLMNITDKKGSFPYLGARFIKIDQYTKSIFNLSRDSGLVIAYVVAESPAEKGGLKAGDIVITINNQVLNSETDLRRALGNLNPAAELGFEVLRDSEVLKFSVILDRVPLDVQFAMIDKEIVNAGASADKVVVTYGLMRFIQSEDELAVILGHELAHIARGHIGKEMGTDLVSILLGIAVGYGAETISPGSGDIVMRGVGGAFSSFYSREFEREADYFGIIYAHKAGYNIRAGVDVWERFAIEMPESMVRDFYSTHPTSTERMLRIEKIVEDIEQGRIALN